MKTLSTCGVLACVSSCGFGPPPAPACVAGFSEGQRLVLTLGVPYDEFGPYRNDCSDASLTTRDDFPDPLCRDGNSCAGRDGLLPGEQVTFALKERHSDEESCSVWVSEFLPQIDGTRDAGPYVDTFEGVSIAYSESSPGGDDVIRRHLLTPGKQWTTELRRGEYPPVVVEREYGTRFGGAACADVWVATWESF